MIKATHYARTSALPAIAAVLALSSTASLAQQAQPTPSEPTTAAPSTPAPNEASPVAQTPSSSTESAPVSAAPDTSASATASAKTSPYRSSARRAATAVKPKANDTHKTHSARATKSAKAAPPAAPAAAPPAAATAAKPVPAEPRIAATPSNGGNDTALEIGGGALAILALGGAAFAIARRRRHEDEDEWYEEQPYEEIRGEPVATAVEPAPVAMTPIPRHDPIAKEQPAIVAPEASAFSWAASKKAVEPSDDGSDRRPGETWVERAYRGPSPANPSVSLRNRLRRAAFFDKREREVAEGRAEPVQADAGLPDARSGDRASEREIA